MRGFAGDFARGTVADSLTAQRQLGTHTVHLGPTFTLYMLIDGDHYAHHCLNIERMLSVTRST